MCRRIHTAQIAVVAVVYAVEDVGGVIEIAVAKALAHGSTFIYQLAMLYGKNQGRSLFLHCTVLTIYVKDILVVPYINDFRIRKAGQNLIRERVTVCFGFYVNV